MSPGNVTNNGHLTSFFPAWPERIKMQTVLNDRGNVLKSDVPFIQYLLRSYRPKLSKNTFVVSSSSSKTACSHPCRRVFTNTDDHLESRLFLPNICFQGQKWIYVQTQIQYKTTCCHQSITNPTPETGLDLYHRNCPSWARWGREQPAEKKQSLDLALPDMFVGSKIITSKPRWCWLSVPLPATCQRVNGTQSQAVADVPVLQSMLDSKLKPRDWSIMTGFDCRDKTGVYGRSLTNHGDLAATPEITSVSDKILEFYSVFMEFLSSKFWKISVQATITVNCCSTSSSIWPSEVTWNTVTSRIPYDSNQN